MAVSWMEFDKSTLFCELCGDLSARLKDWDAEHFVCAVAMEGGVVAECVWWRSLDVQTRMVTTHCR